MSVRTVDSRYMSAEGMQTIITATVLRVNAIADDDDDDGGGSDRDDGFDDEANGEKTRMQRDDERQQASARVRARVYFER